jgi:DnaJ-class molecular chaperone
MPRLGDTQHRGDMFARIRVQVPKALTNDERALYQQLRAAQELPAGAARKGA